MWQHSALASCGTEAVDARNMRRHWDHELRSLHETPGVLLIRSVCTFLSFALHELGTRERLGALTPGMLLMRSVCAFVSFALHARRLALHARRLVRRLLCAFVSFCPACQTSCASSLLLDTSSDIHARRLLRRLSTTANLFAKHLSSSSAKKCRLGMLLIQRRVCQSITSL